MSRTFAVLIVILAIAATALLYWILQQPEERAFIPMDEAVPVDEAASMEGVIDSLTPTSVAGIDPGPIPEGLPLLQREGLDEWGYPRAMIDQVAVVALLHHARYDALNRYLDEVLREVAMDPKKELWETGMGHAFATADPALEPKLDGWIAHSPEHFGPYLARGTFFTTRGYQQRGGSFLDETSRGCFWMSNSASGNAGSGNGLRAFLGISWRFGARPFAERPTPHSVRTALANGEARQLA